MLAAPGKPAGALPVRPDPPVGAADNPPRHVGSYVVPPGGLLCCYTDGLVERRGQVIDHGIYALAEVLGELAASTQGPVPLAERASAAVMPALVGNTPSADDIAVLTLSRHRS